MKNFIMSFFQSKRKNDTKKPDVEPHRKAQKYLLVSEDSNELHLETINENGSITFQGLKNGVYSLYELKEIYFKRYYIDGEIFRIEDEAIKDLWK